MRAPGRSALALPPRSRSAARRYITPLARPGQGRGRAPQGLHNPAGGAQGAAGGRSSGAREREARRGTGEARPLREGGGPHGCLYTRGAVQAGLTGLLLPPAAKEKAPVPRGEREGPPEGGPHGAGKRPARARLPILPQPGAAVLSAKAGLTAEFGTGSGDPRLHGLARAGRSSCGTLAAAWRPIGRSGRAGCAIGMFERRARPISSARLSGSPRLQLRPINLVVYQGPYRREG